MKKGEWERLVEKLIKKRILCTPTVTRAMRSLPRANFLPESMKCYGATDTPLPIGFGQTASAPHSFSIC